MQRYLSKQADVGKILKVIEENVKWNIFTCYSKGALGRLFSQPVLQGCLSVFST